MAPISYKALKILASRYCTYFGTAKLLLFNHRKKATQLIQEVKAMLVVLSQFLMKGEDEIKETRLRKELTYVELADYFPKEIREKYFGKDDEIE